MKKYVSSIIKKKNYKKIINLRKLFFFALKYNLNVYMYLSIK